MYMSMYKLFLIWLRHCINYTMNYCLRCPSVDTVIVSLWFDISCNKWYQIVNGLNVTIAKKMGCVTSVHTFAKNNSSKLQDGQHVQIFFTKEWINIHPEPVTNNWIKIHQKQLTREWIDVHKEPITSTNWKCNIHQNSLFLVTNYN